HDPLPPEAALDGPRRAEATQGARVRRYRPPAAERDPRDPDVERARADPHGVPQPLRAPEPPRPHPHLGLARTPGRRAVVAPSPPPPRDRLGRRPRVGRRPLLAHPGLLLVGHTDHRRIAPLGGDVGVLEPGTERRPRAPPGALPDPRGARRAPGAA